MALRTTFTEAVANVSLAPDLEVTFVPTAFKHTAAFAGTTRTAEPICFGRWPGGSGEFTGQQRCTPGEPSGRPKLAVVFDTTPATLSVEPGFHAFSFISAYGTSHNRTAEPMAQASALYSMARHLADTPGDHDHEDALWGAHLRGMEVLWDARRGGAAILVSGPQPMLARSAWTAIHALTSSMSESWGSRELVAAHAYSPGGLYSGGVREPDYPFVGCEFSVTCTCVRAGRLTSNWEMRACTCDYVFWDQTWVMSFGISE